MIKKDKLYIITGGTGVVGQALCSRILYLGGRVRVMSRSIDKLLKLQEKYKSIEIQEGDVTNNNNLAKAYIDVTGVFHLAALVQAMQSGGASDSIITNLIGSMNVLNQSLSTKMFSPYLNGARDYQVDFVLGVSSDKAVQVSGPYGATKFLMERLFEEFQETNKDIKYRVVRMGNVIYSIDSVLYKWKSLLEQGEEVMVTEPKATRFFMTKGQSVDLMLNGLETDSPKPYCDIPKSTSIGNLLQAMANKYLPKGKELKVKEIGLQPNENLHEQIVDGGLMSNEMEQYTIEELEKMI
jgi:UDP-N-acetylglucosamine 4,6-dehydratase/UDP-glucose 4-epimerase